MWNSSSAPCAECGQVLKPGIAFTLTGELANVLVHGSSVTLNTTRTASQHATDELAGLMSRHDAAESSLLVPRMHNHSLD